MKEIIVTGGSGQLGQAIKEIYLKNIFLFNDKLNISFPEHTLFDITNPMCIDQYVQNRDIVCIINCAAYTDVNAAQIDDTVNIINVDGVSNLVDVCKKHDIFLVQISTDYVFNGSGTVKDENNTIDLVPVNAYGASKLAAETVIKDNLTKYSIIRTSWLYSKYAQNFVKTIIDKLIDNTITFTKPLKVVYDQIGSPTYAKDLANFIMKYYAFEFTKENPDLKSGVFHYSNLGVVSWYDFSMAIKESLSHYVSLSGLDDIIPIRTEDLSTSCPRPKIGILSKEKTIETFNVTIPYWKDSLEGFMSGYIPEHISLHDEFKV